MSEPLAYNTAAAAAATGLSERSLVRAIKAGKLRAKRNAVDADDKGTGRRVILAGDLQQYLDGLVDET